MGITVKRLTWLILGFLVGSGAWLPAQGAGEIFDTFGYSWTTPPGTVPGPVATLGYGSPNGKWKKVIWAQAPGWPLVDYLPEHLGTRVSSGRDCLYLAVVPAPGPGKADGGSEAISTQKHGFGSYRVCCQPTGKTATGTGVCEAMYLFSSQLEIDIEFLSQHQGVTAQRKGTFDIVVHEYRPGNVRASVTKRIDIKDFDPTSRFAVYGFDWRPGVIDFFVAGKCVFTVKDGDIGLMGAAPWQRQIKLPTAANIIKAPLRVSAWTGLPGWCGTAPASRTEFLVDWLSYTPFYLTADKTKLPHGSGGKVNIQLDGGVGQKGLPYLLVPNITGTSTGLPMPGGLILPLDLDYSTMVLLGSVNTPVFANFMGLLDNFGKAQAAFNLPPNLLPPSAIGTTFNFACLVVDPFSLGVVGVSNPIPVTLE